MVNPLDLVVWLARAALPSAPAPELRWSMPQEEVVAALVARQTFAVVVQPRRAIGPRRRIRLLFLPLQEVRNGELLGDPERDWYVDVSEGREPVVTRLPTDHDRLTTALGLSRRSPEGAAVREAFRQLGELLYGERLT